MAVAAAVAGTAQVLRREVETGVAWLDDADCVWLDAGVRAGGKALLLQLSSGGSNVSTGPVLVLKDGDVERLSLNSMIEKQLADGQPLWRSKLFYVTGSNLRGSWRQRAGGPAMPAGVKWRSKGWCGRIAGKGAAMHRYGKWVRTAPDGSKIEFLGRKTTFKLHSTDEEDPNRELIHIRVARPAEDGQDAAGEQDQADVAVGGGWQGTGGQGGSTESGDSDLVQMLLGGCQEQEVQQQQTLLDAGGLCLLASTASADGEAGPPCNDTGGGSDCTSAQVPASLAVPEEDPPPAAAAAAAAAGQHNLWAGLSDAELAAWLQRELREPLPLGKLVQALVERLDRPGLAAVYTEAAASGQAAESTCSSGASSSGGAAGEAAAAGQPLATRFILLARQRKDAALHSRELPPGGSPPGRLRQGQAQGGSAAPAAVPAAPHHEQTSAEEEDVEALAQRLAAFGT
ncbi:hypothetical protein ABPG75_007609 [Micractinium tetrahymenae]